MLSTECHGRGARRHSKRGRGAPAALLALACAAAAFAVPAEAHALPLLTLSGSLRGLYGTTLGDPAVNAYGPGLGLRAGLTLPTSLYLGASFDYFFGESDSAIDTSASLLQIMGNVGYDAGLGPLTLRPSLGLGIAQSSVEVANVDTSEGDFLLSPGAELFIGLGLLSVSGEVRYNKVFADGDFDGVYFGLGLGFSL